MTPYQTAVAVKARRRAQFEHSVRTGWFAERFAREERLSGLDHYLNPPPGLAEAEAEAEITRWAVGHGLEVVDIEDEE